MKLPFDPAEPIEYVTFGRQTWLLFRVWLLQIVIVFFEMEILRGIHPTVLNALGKAGLVDLYLAITTAALVVIALFARRMGRLTFAPTFHDPVHIALSVVAYIVLAAVVVIPAAKVAGVPPALADGATTTEALLLVFLSTTLAAFIIVEFYALFDLEDSPSRRDIETTTKNWLCVLDWYTEPEGSREKRARYEEFREHTEELAALLEYAVTSDGRAIRRDFDAWRETFEHQSLLSQEAIARGDVRNERLQRQHEELVALVERFERISGHDAPS